MASWVIGYKYNDDNNEIGICFAWKWNRFLVGFDVYDSDNHITNDNAKFEIFIMLGFLSILIYKK